MGISPALATLKPVLVLGANGKTGAECVAALVARGIPCVAATRSGIFSGGPQGSKLVTVAAGDVTKSLDGLIAPGGLGGVIFAASRSKEGGSARAVDQLGLISTAKRCIACGVPRLVVVSSGGVSRPNSNVYRFLNTVAGGIMDAKIAGEDTMRSLYAAPGLREQGIGYTVIRPGGLTTDAGRGAGAVELNQGDDKSGRIARADVAALCVESLGAAAALDTTFECYYSETAKGLEEVMGSNAKGVASKGATDDPTVYVSGKERRASTWAKLFEGLERGV